MVFFLGKLINILVETFKPDYILLTEYIAADNIEQIKPFLQKYQVKDQLLRSLFLEAIKHSSMKTMQYIMKLKAFDINAKNGDGITALIYSSYRSSVDIVKELLKDSNIDINAKNTDGVTALMAAIGGNNVNVVEELLKYPNIDINAKNADGITALIAAADKNPKIIKLLLDTGHIKIITQTEYLYLSLKGSEENINLFHEYGYDIIAGAQEITNKLLGQADLNFEIIN